MAVTARRRKTKGCTESGLSADFTLFSHLRPLLEGFAEGGVQVRGRFGRHLQRIAEILTMHTALSNRLAQAFALVAGMALVMGAYAAEGHGEHGGGHGEAKEAKEASIKPSLKPDLKAEAKGEGKSEPKGEGKAEPKGEGKANVSMAELRDLIDQKIAEVRTRREPAPVLHVRARAPRAPRPEVHAAASPALQDPHGALLPAGGRGADAHGASPAGHDIHWAYSGDTGPESWGRLKPEFQQCMLGKRQSPIDIREGIPVQLDPIQFDYRPSGFRVIDNGHTVQVNVEPGNSIVVSGRRYDLLQFHFHRPSEERINGRQFEMVAHLVHKDLDGKLAVVAVLMDQGKMHPLVQQVWNNLPLEKNSEQAAMTQLDMNLLLPEQRQYYTYMGSLTTPPCSEGVLWMVMKSPAAMSREQISVFTKLYPMNARPIQQASGRLIKEGQ
jgi:carbonic anhydrase